MVAANGPTITRVPHPLPWFTLASNRHAHRVHGVVHVAWPNGPWHESIAFRCGGLSQSERGRYSVEQPPDSLACARCEERGG